MIIQSSNISMYSRRSYTSKSSRSEGLTYWGVSNGRRDEEAMDGALEQEGISGDERADVKNEIKRAQNIENPYKGKTLQQIRSEVVNYLLDLFFGDGKAKNLLDDFYGGSRQAFGGTYSKSSYFYEKETTSFQTNGSVVTADGRRISFQVDVEMTRSFASAVNQQIHFGAARVCDPLVINLDSSIASVSDQKFLFDLDVDGEEDEISMLTGGSGFLALDRNGNGKIDNGSELFGTKSGDGFADLEAYDIDKNGWIDEADAIFDKLRIWYKDENGNDRLVKLKEAGIGAICLRNTDTQFSLNNHTTNRTNAYIRKSGIFLYENGGVGTVQHLDLVQ